MVSSSVACSSAAREVDRSHYAWQAGLALGHGCIIDDIHLCRNQCRLTALLHAQTAKKTPDQTGDGTKRRSFASQLASSGNVRFVAKRITTHRCATAAGTTPRSTHSLNPVHCTPRAPPTRRIGAQAQSRSTGCGAASAAASVHRSISGSKPARGCRQPARPQHDVSAHQLLHNASQPQEARPLRRLYARSIRRPDALVSHSSSSA